MKPNVAINGFGRIGRMVFRRAMMEEAVNIVCVNASYPAETLAHLIKYDSIHGKFSGTVKTDGDALIVNGKRIELVHSRNPRELPWKKLNVSIVVEATGKFRTRETAFDHVRAGADKVIITAPGKEEDVMIVCGVNDNVYDHDKHRIISGASCTTNCLAPIVHVLEQRFGVVEGMMTTVHAYTNDQKNIDNPHKDLRRARACGESIIPTTTGAAEAIGKVLPHLAGKLTGVAVRVPTANVSLVDLVVDVRRSVTVNEVNGALRSAAKGELSGILDYTDEPLVSVDFNGNEHSAIVDGLSTAVLGERKIKVLAWYDNEWGYSCRIVDLVKKISTAYQSKQKAHAS